MLSMLMMLLMLVTTTMTKMMMVCYDDFAIVSPGKQEVGGSNPSLVTAGPSLMSFMHSYSIFTTVF